MKVIDADGNLVGTVKDVSFTIGRVGISLNVEDMDGQMRDIPWENVQGAGDFIVLKPTAEGAAETAHHRDGQRFSLRPFTSSLPESFSLMGSASLHSSWVKGGAPTFSTTPFTSLFDSSTPSGFFGTTSHMS